MSKWQLSGAKKVDAVNIFPKLAVYLRTHYSKWQQNQRVRDALAKAAPGEARLHEINAGFGIQSAATTTKATMVPVVTATNNATATRHIGGTCGRCDCWRDNGWGSTTN